MRPFKIILTLFFACCLLNNPLRAQCSGEAGSPNFPTTLCQGSQSDVGIDALDIPEDYAFQLFVTTSDVFSFAEVVYQNDQPVILDDNLPEGTYYIYSAIAPELPDGSPDYDSECFQLSAPLELVIINLVMTELPDTIFSSCADPEITVDFVESPSSGIGVDIFLDGVQIGFGVDPTFTTSTAGFYQAQVGAPLAGENCFASSSFHLVFSDFVLPQERNFVVPCSGDYQVCIEPWDAEQTYELDGVPITDPCIDNLPPGFYQLNITRPDCSNTESASLRVRNSFPFLSLSNDDFANCNQADGSMTVTINGGTPPYQLFQDGAFIQEIQEDGGGIVLANLAAGIYLYEVVDALGCTANLSGTVNQAPLYTAVEMINASCPNSSDGGLVIIPGIDPPYTYVWSDGSTGSELLNVPPGTYSVTINSGGGCTQVHTQAVGSDSNLAVLGQVTDSNCGEENGSIDLFITGGVQPYSFVWSTGNTLEDLTDLAPGQYSVTVTDNNGCSVTELFTVNSLGFVEATIVQTGSFLCDGFVTLSLQYEGELELGVIWYEFDVQIGTGPSLIVEDDAPGTYTAAFAPIDNPACTGNQSVVVHSTRSQFQITVAPGLPCAPMVLGPPNGLYYNYEWTGPDGQVIETPDLSVVAFIQGWYTLSATDITGECPVADSIFITPPNCNFVGGSLRLDEGNCLAGEDEIPIPNARIRLLPIDGNPAEVQFAYTDFSGNWSTSVPYGSYAVQFQPYVDGLYQDCAPPFEVTITPSGPTPFVELLVTAVELCPRINVDLAIPFLRRCFDSNIYVQYCNEGTDPAIDASITVELDEFLIFQSSNPAPTEVDGTTLTYAVGDLDPFACGQIQIRVLTSCDAVLGQSHCVEVVVSPNDPCPTPSDEWNGAIVNVRPVCNDDDEPAFIIENTGFGNMSVPLQYIIVEDGVILMPELVTVDPLAIGQEIVLDLPGNGASYWIQTNQEPLSPGASMPTAFLENCSFDGDGNFSTGFANQFFDGDDLPWYEQRCIANIGAYDPNDKQAIPIGYGSPHYIEPETPIEYTIRFQNTGTDTAFNVYILDEISPLLDPESLRMGASSHEYRASIDSNRTLDIRFDNIMLPDSNIDLAGSQGFVQFTIAPYPDLPLPSLIENRAGIYFDFNEPVITNTVFHTVDTGFVRGPSSIFSPPTPLANITLSPNPTPDGQVRVELRTNISGPYLAVVLDGLGRRMTSLPMNSKSEQLQLGYLPAGTYSLAVFDRQGRWLSTTKLIR